MVQNDYHINGVYKEYHSVRMVHIHNKMLVPYGTFITVMYLLKNVKTKTAFIVSFTQKCVAAPQRVLQFRPTKTHRVICSVISI